MNSPVATTESDLTLVLFRTCGHLDADGRTWVLPVHAWAFHPQKVSRMQRATLALFRQYIRYKTRTAANDLFTQRTQSFFVGNRKGLPLHVALGDREYRLEKTGSNGHLTGVLRVPADWVQSCFDDGTGPFGWLNFQARIPELAETPLAGRILCPPQQGISIISDIDDTIKHSQVRNRGELLANTFYREFVPIPEVAAVYQSWLEAGAQFHYVSSSPWQLHELLVEFLRAEGFPEGSLHLRFIRLRDTRLLPPFVFRRENKAHSIHRVLQQHPQRKFVLIGDSGEKDPEIYGTAARKFPNQVMQILIRDVTGHGVHARRYRKAFHGLPNEQWDLYREAGELADLFRQGSERWGSE